MSSFAWVRLWAYRLGLIIAVGVGSHVAAVWLTPRVIMYQLLNSPLVSMGPDAPDRAVFMPKVDASSRSVVMPSPDMLYSACVYDLSKGPMMIRADPKLPTYWSIALYSSKSDNFFVVNDRDVGNEALYIWLVPPDGAPNAEGMPANARVVVAPTSKGFVLFRVLVADYNAEGAKLEPARRSFTCRKLGGKQE